MGGGMMTQTFHGIMNEAQERHGVCLLRRERRVSVLDPGEIATAANGSVCEEGEDGGRLGPLLTNVCRDCLGQDVVQAQTGEAGFSDQRRSFFIFSFFLLVDLPLGVPPLQDLKRRVRDASPHPALLRSNGQPFLRAVRSPTISEPPYDDHENMPNHPRPEPPYPLDHRGSPVARYPGTSLCRLAIFRGIGGRRPRVPVYAE